MNTTKQQARLGMFHLKEAVVNVLFEAQEETPLLPDAIRKRLGLPTDGGNNFTIKGILFVLRNEERAVYIDTEERKGWKITDDEAVLLRESA